MRVTSIGHEKSETCILSLTSVGCAVGEGLAMLGDRLLSINFAYCYGLLTCVERVVYNALVVLNK